ncbi:MAG TPA: error-prone DNA polymerase [Porticoccaceae bacterium]|jgi:error-prone DNA polymerase|nr:error-prone DNA polymerase [Gammaproteobacteria bacterium]HIL61018.1 error-prone DNA polymerase [Porticoccaceae bacterium]
MSLSQSRFAECVEPGTANRSLKEKSEEVQDFALPVYAELHCISNFTFLRGASFPEELVSAADSLGYSALAITDECSFSGVVRAHVAAKEKNIELIIGSEFLLNKELPNGDSVKDCRLIMLASNRVAYGRLSHLITCARRETKKGDYRIDRKMVENNYPQDCLSLWVPDLEQSAEVIASQATWLQRIFLGHLWIACELLLRGDDRLKLQQLQKLGEQFSIALCATGGVYMHAPQRRILQDTLSAIRHGKLIKELGFDGECNGQRHLRTREQLAKLYPQKLLDETNVIAQQCHFSLDELRYEYPRELVPPAYTPSGWLRELTEAGIRQRWPDGAKPKVRNIIEHELALIKELDYEHYFLTVHDMVAYARSQHILCQGRGSAANSAVCYCLGITEVDPAHIEVLFERFISRERNEPPDIDIDFENARREEVIQYIYNKYGRDRAAIAATVITYRSRSAIRDVGKALGLDDELLNHLAKSIYWWGSNLKEQLSDSGVDHSDPAIQQLVALAQSLIGFPRHLSQHVGGFIISQGPLSHLVPIENATMANRTVIQWEKRDLESLGLLKIDVLALGMLTAVQKCLGLVSNYSKEALTIQKIPPEDPAVYDMMGQADTIGVFQIESRAQMSMLPQLKPRSYYDLVIQIAIVRPGPIQGDMVHPYLNRRNGKEPVSYPSEAVRETLERTLGVPIFQEQVMQLAMVAAGFSGGEADQLRRAMAAWKRKSGLEPYEGKLVNGMLERGYDRGFAEQLFRQIKGFGDYGFPESHSASFALIAYVSSWFKYYHPAAFCCALLNSQPMGFYAPAQLIKDAQRHGVKVLPIDVNVSSYDCTLEFDQGYQKLDSPCQQAVEPKLRIGFCLVKGMSEFGAKAITEARQSVIFKTIHDLVFRSGINKKDLESLAAADALKGLSGDRHRAFWQASGLDSEHRGLRKRFQEKKALDNLLTKDKINQEMSGGSLSFFTDPEFADGDFGVDVLLPVASEGQNIVGDYTSTGFTLRRHPLSLFREHLNTYRVSTANDLSSIDNEGNAKVTGLVTCRQRPMTAAGVTFLTLEDESGSVNVVIWPSLGERLRPIVRQAMLIGVVGHVQKSDGVIHLIARQLVDLSHWLGTMELSSRDFT